MLLLNDAGALALATRLGFNVFFSEDSTYPKITPSQLVY
jgi:hypothetical protein